MAQITLNPAEIFSITRKTQPAAQLRKLRHMGIRAYRTDDPEQPVTVCREWLAAPKAAPTAERSKPQIRSANGSPKKA